MSSNTYYSTVISRFLPFCLQVTLSAIFQMFKTFEYLSRSNMAKCSNFSEIEGKVQLKRSFQLTGNENMVPVSESPTYPGSYLSEVFS